MKLYQLFLVTLLVIGLTHCSPSASEGTVQENPPADGFNEEASDAEAIVLADAVMEAMGGRAAWDETRYLKWTFFGRRTLWWDKFTGDVRIEIPADSTVFLVNIFDKTGKVGLQGKSVTDADSLRKYLDRAESIWINDAYWLVMPFKLKDSGVTLKYLGKDTIQGGDLADVLQLTFEEVGRTPNNKYLIYVDQKDSLVKQWDFFTNYEDPEPRFSTPWLAYQQHGPILLSGDRGRNNLTDIAVMESVKEGTFTNLEPLSE